MPHLITFRNAQFDAAAETPNPINPIAGKNVLSWLGEQLRAAGLEVTVPEPEDWGWYIHVKDREGSYLVGASSDLDQPMPREWAVQIHRERSLTDRLLGRNKLADDDVVSARIETFIREGGGAQDVQIDKST